MSRELEPLEAEVHALKRLQAKTAAELDAFPPSPRLRRTSLPAILQSSPGFRLHRISTRQVDATSNRVFKEEL